MPVLYRGRTVLKGLSCLVGFCNVSDKKVRWMYIPNIMWRRTTVTLDECTLLCTHVSPSTPVKGKENYIQKIKNFQAAHSYV